MLIKIPTYVINLASRSDRRLHIQSQFKGRSEFELHIVPAEAHEVGAVGLWNTLTKILRTLEGSDNEFILICEDDHQFTEAYSKEILFSNIKLAESNQADILLGGVSSIQSIITVSQSVLWVEGFTGLQFTIIYKKFYKTIVNAYFRRGDAADLLISSLSQKKFLVHPFVSTQREFGYSDVTSRNSAKGFVSGLFDMTVGAIQYIKDVEIFYDSTNSKKEGFNRLVNFEDVCIPTFVINLPKRTDRLSHITKQFEGKTEFDVKIIDAEQHRIGALGLWKTIRRIVQIAIDDDDDVIVICEDDHMFTRFYNRDYFLSNILEAHTQGVDILSGGIGGGFSHATVASKTRFWINHFFSTQFIVIYNKFFTKILDRPFDAGITADDCFSELTTNKMVLYPFISTQKDFGYSDATSANNVDSKRVTKLFEDCSSRLMLIKEAHTTFFGEKAEK
jgi:GR25 family glycosyltransferase involved in LPS biosynthesis